MAEFIHSEEKIVKPGDTISFANEIKPSLEVATGVIFKKSGIYNVSVVGRYATITCLSHKTDRGIRAKIYTWLSKTVQFILKTGWWFAIGFIMGKIFS